MMIFNIQVLRALAASLVVLFHVQDSAARIGQVPLSIAMGTFGVDIFFVVSGFIMFHTTAGFRRSGGEFLLDRAIRVVPLYWVATLALVSLLAVGFEPNGLHRTSVLDVVTSLLMIPRLLTDGREPVVLKLGWTLIYEMFFYATFAATFFLRSHLKSLIVLVALFAALSLLREPISAVGFTPGFFTRSIIFEFLYGCALALVFARPPGQSHRRGLLAGWGAIVAGFALVFAVPADRMPPGFDARAITAGLPALLVVGGALLLERAGQVWRWRPLLVLGNASYALYLFHPLVLQPAVAMARRAPLQGWPMAIFVAAFALAAACLLAVVIHFAIEKPMTGVLRRRLTRPLAQEEPLARARDAHGATDVPTTAS